MAARLLDGTAVAQAIRQELAAGVAAFTARAGRPPGLGLVLVGDDPASELYVRSKLKSAGETGLRADLERLPATARSHQLLALVDRLNRSDVHDGILVQSPLPDAMGPDAERRVFDALDRTRTSTASIRSTSAGSCRTGRPLVACTPSGVIELLERSGIPIAGARAVVIGRSDIVGKPMALLLLHRHATVTICHSRTADLPASRARPTSWSRRSAGRRSSRRTSSSRARRSSTSARPRRATGRSSSALFPPGSKRREAFERRGVAGVGDVHPAVEEVAGALTPVPGGVGPLTIAMLLKNTLTAARATARAAG